MLMLCSLLPFLILNQDGDDEGGALTAAASADDSLDPAVQAAPAAELSVSDAEVGHQHSSKLFCVRYISVCLSSTIKFLTSHFTR